MDKLKYKRVLIMLDYIIQLPCEVMGHNVLGFLELIDIIQFENAAAGYKSQQLLRTIFPHCPPIMVTKPPENLYSLNAASMDWFKKRQCRVQLVRIGVKLLSKGNFDYSILEGSFKLCLGENTTPGDIVPLDNPNLSKIVTRLHIYGYQDHAVMEVLFSLLSSVGSLDIRDSNLSQWMKHIKKIGPCLRELCIKFKFTDLKTLTEYCPYLEKLSMSMRYGISVSDSSMLQIIANNCPQIRSLDLQLYYVTTDVADADLTAFAEKCPQLEELSLNCEQLTDQSVIALAQQCSRLKKLKLQYSTLNAAVFRALSERGLPLEELDIPRFPIPSAELAAQCAHALSRIPQLSTVSYILETDDVFYVAQYMTGLHNLYLNSSDDHLLVPHLQQGHCASVEILTIGSDSSITPQQLNELVTGCNQLHTLRIHQPTCTSEEILVPVELARSCPHLQEIILDCRSELTEEGVLALATHCRQLREINIPYIACTVETVKQLAQHCRRLTKLLIGVHFMEGEILLEYRKYYDIKEIKALRAQGREVITHRNNNNNNNNNTCCLIL